MIALLPIALLCGIAAFRAQRIRWIALGAVFCLLGAWCAEMEPQPASEPAIATLSDGLVRTVEGTVTNTGSVRIELDGGVEEPGRSTITQRADVRVASIEIVSDDEDLQAPVDGGVRLTVRWPDGDVLGDSHLAAGFRCGDRIRAWEALE